MLLSPFFQKLFIAPVLFFTFFCMVPMVSASANEVNHEVFDSKEVTFHHVLDQYDWEFFKMPDGTPVKILLPRIFYDKHAKKLVFFKSTEDAREVGFCDALPYTPDAKHGDLYCPALRKGWTCLPKNWPKRLTLRFRKTCRNEL